MSSNSGRVFREAALGWEFAEEDQKGGPKIPGLPLEPALGKFPCHDYEADKREGWKAYAEPVQEELRGFWNGQDDILHETSYMLKTDDGGDGPLQPTTDHTNNTTTAQDPPLTTPRSPLGGLKLAALPPMLQPLRAAKGAGT